MNPPANRPLPAEIVEAAAAAWLSLRDRGMSPEETDAFLRWLQRDPRHAEIFAELDRTWRSLDPLAAVPVERAPAGKADADLLAPRPRRRGRLAFVWATLGAAAAIALVFVGAGSLRPSPRTLATEVGAFRRLHLPDGSVAQLNTDSLLDVAYAAGERSVRVVRGEVFFTVAKDPARPFLVAAGPVEVRAVGTAFNVRHRPGGVEVLVTEGRVRIDDRARGASVLPPAAGSASPLLVAGEKAVVTWAPSAASAAPAPARIERVSELAVQRALAWQERRLEFDAAPLAEVVDEFNRYSRRRLVIADAALAARRFSGAFRADNLDSFVRLLETDFDVMVESRGDEIFLRPGR